METWTRIRGGARLLAQCRWDSRTHPQVSHIHKAYIAQLLLQVECFSDNSVPMIGRAHIPRPYATDQRTLHNFQGRTQDFRRGGGGGQGPLRPPGYAPDFCCCDSFSKLISHFKVVGRLKLGTFSF